MSFKDVLKTIMETITGEALVGAMEGIKDTVEQTTRKVVKSLALFVLFIIGLLFVLIGLANYLEARFLWIDGMGLVIVGVVVILLGFFAKAMR